MNKIEFVNNEEELYINDIDDIRNIEVSNDGSLYFEDEYGGRVGFDSYKSFKKMVEEIDKNIKAL